MIKQYDTLKSKDKKTWRVLKVEGDKLEIKEVKYSGGDFRSAPGRARKISMQDIENGTYTKLNTAPVKVYKTEKREEVKVPAPHEKAAQNANESLTEVCAGLEYIDSDEVLMLEKEIADLKQANEELRHINEEWAGGKKEDLDILRAECIDLQGENEKLCAEAKELKKTISKMRQDHEHELSRLKQEHESEVQDLKDRIMELEILAKKKSEYADALDDDSVAFEEILVLAELVQSAAKQAHNAAKLIGAKTEGRI